MSDDFLKHQHVSKRQYISKDQINDMSTRFRANFINCLSGFKSANLVGTISPNGDENVAIVSSVMHLGSNPGLFAMVIRPHSVRRDTLGNIQDTGVYTINHIGADFIQQAHQTSAKYAQHQSEFVETGLTSEYLQEFRAPYVKESPIKLGMNLCEIIPIKQNDTLFIIGEIQDVHVPSTAVSDDGFVSLASEQIACINGLDSYGIPEQGVRFSYARTGEVAKPMPKT